jgi:tRNA(His) 5'-end guanylyltransferase
MDHAASVLAKDMMGCRFAYGQSDEYSFLATDFERHESQQWFGGGIQKIASISASVFTAAFNSRYQRPDKVAVFDARVFTLPSEDEVLNYFIWRQKDAERNSLNMLASCHISHQKLMNMNSEQRHDLLHRHGENWNNWPTAFKRGRVIRKMQRERDIIFTHKKTKQEITQHITETYWAPDLEIPVFTANREYLLDLTHYGSYDTGCVIR